MTKRVTVFIDYQNVYKRARGIFELKSFDNAAGQINPIKVARLLVQKLGGDCAFEQVRTYRGIPSNNLDPKGYGAVRRQTASWMKGGQPVVAPEIRDPLLFLYQGLNLKTYV